MGNSLDCYRDADDEVEDFQGLCPFPEWGNEMVEAGHFHSTFILSTIYVPLLGGNFGRGKPNPRMPEVGEVAEVRLPKSCKHAEAGGSVFPRLLGKYGKDFYYASIWRGDEERQGKCIHVTLQPAFRGETAILMEVDLVKNPALFGDRAMSITSFISRMLEALWLKHGLREILFAQDGLAHTYRDYTWVFSGCSHGATMAQAITLLFAMEAEKRMPGKVPDVKLISFNGYRWLDEAGRQEMVRYIGDRQINIVACCQTSRITWLRGPGTPLVVDGVTVSKWDPTAGFPWTCVNVPGLFLMDIEDSRLFPIARLPDVHPAQLPKRWYALHFARQYMYAVSGLNEIYFGEDAEEQHPHEDEILDLELQAEPLGVAFGVQPGNPQARSPQPVPLPYYGMPMDNRTLVAGQPVPVMVPAQAGRRWQYH
mmetsp:Transcript_44177/g.104578  ORF Transcript_44177/g.104578 Transcript_44177/m.104578 type:complete len:424 (-) Transcript_44177:56-1327(-)